MNTGSHRWLSGALALALVGRVDHQPVQLPPRRLRHLRCWAFGTQHEIGKANRRCVVFGYPKDARFGEEIGFSLPAVDLLRGIEMALR